MKTCRLILFIIVSLGIHMAHAGQWPSYLHVYRGSTPTIDGKLSPGEWDDATVFYGVEGWNDQFPDTPVKDPEDLSLIGYAKHDGENLYFAFDITDDVLYGIDTDRWVPDENPEHVHDFTKKSWPWFGDGIELLINALYKWPEEDETFNHGDARSWQVVVNHSKSLLGGIGKGGLIQGEQRDNPVAWKNHEKWIRDGHMKAVSRVKDDKSGYVVEWMISPTCLQVDKEGTIWSPDLGMVKMGLNIGVQDLDHYDTAPDNWGRFHHEPWWAGETDKRTWPKQWGTMYVHPDLKVKELFVSPCGRDNNPGQRESPLATLHESQQRIRKMKEDGVTGHIMVWLREGIYRLDSPLVFNHFHSGNDNLKITYKSYSDETAVISGAREIYGKWEKYKENIWSINIPEVHSKQWWFRQLFKNGQRQTRARYPNEGQWLTVDDVALTGDGHERGPRKIIIEDSLPFSNLARQDSEIVLFNLWSISRARVNNSGRDFVQSWTPLGWIGHSATTIQPGRKFYLEHALSFVDQPGEWYLDRNNCTLYYKAQRGQNPNDYVWEAPFSSQLLRIQGRNDEPVVNLHFEGISFQYTNWQIPLGGYAGIQAGFYGTRYITEPTYSPEMAILLKYAQNCTFHDVTLSNTGAGGIGLGAGTVDNEIKSCHIFDIGGTGVLVGWRRIANEPPRQWFESGWKDHLDVPRRNKIVNNTIHNCGVIHLSSTGIFSAFTEDTLIAHNEIFDLPHIGITVGFIWDDTPTTQKRTIVEYNHIHHCMKRLIDGAGIYTLGYQPGTIIRNNYIHDILNGHGLYTDEGSSHILFENNIIFRTGLRGYNHNYGHHNIIRNNIFAYPSMSAEGEMWGNFTDANFMLYPEHLVTAAIRRNRADFDVDLSFTFTRNIVVFDKGEYYLEGFNGKANTIKVNRNVIWNSVDKDNITFNNGINFDQWKKLGHDNDSIISDPLFEDAKNGNFTLDADSPAFKIGFEPIDMENIGRLK